MANGLNDNNQDPVKKQGVPFTMSEEGLKKILEFETQDLSQTLEAYPDPGQEGGYSIGGGTKSFEGEKITEEEALKRFHEYVNDVAIPETAALFKNWETIPHHKKEAIVNFTYNFGLTRFTDPKKGFTNFIDAVNNDDWERASREVLVNKQGLPNIYSKTHSKRAQWISSEMIRDARITSQYTPEQLKEMERLHGLEKPISTKDPNKTTQEVRDEMREAIGEAEMVEQLVGTGEPVDPQTITDLDRTEEMIKRFGGGINQENANVRNWYNDWATEDQEKRAAAGTIDPNYDPRGKFLNSKDLEYRMLNPIKKHERFIKDVNWNPDQSPSGFAELIMQNLNENNKDTVGNIRLGGVISQNIDALISELEKTNFYPPNTDRKTKEDILKTLIYQDFSYKLGGFDPENDEHIRLFSPESKYMKEILDSNLYDYYLDNMASAYEAYEMGVIPTGNTIIQDGEETISELNNEEKDLQLEKLMELKPFALYPNKEAVDNYVKRVAPHEGKEMGEGWWSATNNQWAYKVSDLANITAPVVVAGKPGQSYDMHWSSEMGAWMTLPLTAALLARSGRGAGTVAFNTLVGDAVLSVMNPREPNIANMIREMGGAGVVSRFIGEGVGKHVDEFLSENAVLRLMSNKAEDSAFKRAFAGAIEGEVMARTVPKAVAFPFLIVGFTLAGLAKGSIKSIKAGGQLIDYVVSELKLDPEQAKKAKEIYAANSKKIINKAYSIGSLDMFFDHINAATKAIKGAKKGKGNVAIEYHETIRNNIGKVFDSEPDGAYKALSVVNGKINDLLTGRQDLVGTKEELKQLRLTQAAMYEEMAKRGIPIGRASGQKGAGREGIYHLYDSWNKAVHGLREMEFLLENNNWRKRQYNPQRLNKGQIERSISRLESAMNGRRKAIKNQNLIDPDEWRKFDPNESLYDFLNRTEGYVDLRENKSAFEYRQSIENLDNARKNQGGFIRFGGSGKGEPIKPLTAKEIEMQSFSDEAEILRDAAEFDIEFEAKFELKKSELVDEYVDVFGVSKSAANKKNKTQLSEELAEHAVRESKEMARVKGGVSPWDVARTAANKKKLKPIEEKINSLPQDDVKKAAAERGISIEGKTILETKEAIIIHDYAETLKGKAKEKYLEKIKKVYPDFEAKFKDKPKEAKPEKTVAQREADFERPVYNHLESSPEELREIAESRGLMITEELSMFSSPEEIANVLNKGALNLEESFNNQVLINQQLEFDMRVNNVNAKTRYNKLLAKEQKLVKKLKEEGYTDEQIEELKANTLKRFEEGERYVPLQLGVDEVIASKYSKLGLKEAGIDLLENIINNESIKDLWPWNYRALDPTEKGAKNQLKELISLIGVPIGKNNKLWKEENWYDLATKEIDNHIDKARRGEFAEASEAKVEPVVEAEVEPKQKRKPKLSSKEQDINAKQADERQARIEDAEETKEFNNLESFDTAEQAAKSLRGIEDKLNKAARRMITNYQRWVKEGSQPNSVEAARFESSVMLYQRQKAKQEILQAIIDGKPEIITGKQKVIRQMLPPSAKATDDQMVEWSIRNNNKGRYSAENYVKFFGDVLVEEADEFGTPSSEQVKKLRDLFDTDPILKERSVNRKISWKNPFLSAPRIQASMLAFGNSGLVSSIGTLTAAATGGGIFKYPRYWWDKIGIRALASDANPIASNEVRVWAKNYLKFFDEVSQDPRFDEIRPIMGRKYKELKKQYNLPEKSEYNWMDKLLRLLIPSTNNQARAKTFEELTGKRGEGKVVDVKDPANPPIEMFNNPSLDVPVHGVTNPTMIVAEMDKGIKKDILMVLLSIQEFSARHGMANTVDRFTKGFGGKPHMTEILKELTGIAIEMERSGTKVLDIDSEDGMNLIKEMFFSLQEWNQLRAQGILGQNVSQDAWMKNRMGLWASTKEIPKEGTPEFDVINSSPYALERYKEYVGLEVVDADVATANKNVLEMMYNADNRARSRMEELTMQNEDYKITELFANISQDRVLGYFGRFGRTAANTMTFGTERIPIFGLLQERLFRKRFVTSPTVQANALNKLQASMAIIGIAGVINRNIGYQKDETEIVGYDEQGKPIKQYVQRAFTTVPSKTFRGMEDVALVVKESVEDCKEYFLKRWSKSPEMLDYKIKNDANERGDYSYVTEAIDSNGEKYYIVTKEQKDAWIEDRVWALMAPAHGGGSTMTFDRAGAASNMLFSGVRANWALEEYSPRFKSKELIDSNFAEDFVKLTTNVYYENISSFPFDLAMNIYDFGGNASLDNLFSLFMNDAVLTPSVGLYKDVTDTRGDVVYDTKGMSKTMAQVLKAPIVEYGVFGLDPTVDNMPVNLNYISLPVGKDKYAWETLLLGKPTMASDFFDKLLLDLDSELLQPYEPKFNTGGANVYEDIDLREFESEPLDEKGRDGNVFNAYEWYHTTLGDIKIQSSYLSDPKVYNRVAGDPKINHVLINNKKTVNLIGELKLYTLTEEFVSDYNAAMRIKGWNAHDINGKVTKHTLINPVSNSTKTWTDNNVWKWAEDKNNRLVSDQERFDLTTLIANKEKFPEPYEEVMDRYRRLINRQIYDDGLNARTQIEKTIASIRTRFTDKVNEVITDFSNRGTRFFKNRFGWVKEVRNKDGKTLDEVLKTRLNTQTGTIPLLQSTRQGRLNREANDYTIEVFNE